MVPEQNLRQRQLENSEEEGILQLVSATIFYVLLKTARTRPICLIYPLFSLYFLHDEFKCIPSGVQEGQLNFKTKRQRDKETKRQRDKETKRQRDKETKRQRNFLLF
jgi:hypothetical protein